MVDWGVRDCMVWNLATVGQYVWQVSQKEDLIWIKWIHCVYAQAQPKWGYTAPTTASKGWKVICKAQEKFKLACNSNDWLYGGSNYNVKVGYDWLVGDLSKVRWHFLVWNSLNIPKRSFISCLTALVKLKTRKTLDFVGICSNQDCLLCA